jgi:hypothetical protein
MGPANPAQTELAALHTPAVAGGEHQLLSLSNPLVAVLGLAALTIGAAAFSTSVRVGHTTARLAVGNA